MSDQVIQLTAKRCEKGRIEHGPYLVDERNRTVECGTCGMKLDAIETLIVMYQAESRYKMRWADIKKKAEQASERNRTKCEHCKQMTRIIK